MQRLIEIILRFEYQYPSFHHLKYGPYLRITYSVKALLTLVRALKIPIGLEQQKFAYGVNVAFATSHMISITLHMSP